MKNEVEKFRNTDSFYTKISSDLIRDTRISNGAFRLMSMILADNDEFAPIQWWLQEKLGIKDKRTTRKYMKELREYGYIERKRIQGGYSYKINEIPLGTKNDSSHKMTPVKKCTLNQDQVLTQDQVLNKEPLDNRSFSDPTNDLICSISNHPLFPKDTFVPTVNEEGNKVIIDIEEKPSMSLNEDLDIDLPDIEMNFLNKDVFSDYLTNS